MGPGTELWWGETKGEKKNQRIQHLNAIKDFEERGLGTLLWVVGGTEEDGEGPLLHVDGDKHSTAVSRVSTRAAPLGPGQRDG